MSWTISDSIRILALVSVLSLTNGPTMVAADEPAASLRVRDQVVLNHDAWTWNWSSWDQEKIVTVGDYQYTVYWDADRVCVLARRDLQNNDVQTLRLPKFKLSANDRHRNTCLGVSPADATWSRLGMLFSSQGVYGPWQNSTSRCAYLHDVLFDGRNRLHASWVYRETGASWASNHDLHYAYSDDQGKTWHNNRGEKIADLPHADPIELADPGIVVREIPVYSWLMNAGCMALDSHDRPHVVTFKLPTVHRPGNHRPRCLKTRPPTLAAEPCPFVHGQTQAGRLRHPGRRNGPTAVMSHVATT